ncbi:Orn/DAP/Arg decarboxylase 2 [Desulfatibacillum aliphaticivorans]|uniref:Orn/DAP/Arg decarboxylase 2 n=2 Tax=Desulfatibacillum aliphaticivorans TaxID=218208 RepID=B8FAA8_DESAL|nr:Orn/DAP/Arg decarboxylase 2 [Desulfatibacillum aliphaticivorans]
MDLNTLFKILMPRIHELDTPCFVYNLDIIEKNIQKLRQVLRPDKILFGVRCNPLPQVLKILHQNQCGFDVGNPAELEYVKQVAGDGADCFNGCPIASAESVKEMYAQGFRIFSADSASQVENLAANAPNAKVLIRVSSSNAGSVIADSHRLGVEESHANRLLDYAATRGLEVCGLSFHPGSQCGNLENWKAGISTCARLAREYPSLKILHIAGGFPALYQGSAPDACTVADAIRQAIGKYYPFTPVLWMQPSRFLTADAAVTLTTAVHTDESCYPRRLFVDASVFAGHGEILTMNNRLQYPICGLAPASRFYHYQVHGCTSSGVDTFAADALLPEVRVDHVNPSRSSRIVICNAGAYCASFVRNSVRTGFNGSKAPGLYFLKGEELVKNL